MAKTGPFPKSPKDPREFRISQMKGMKGFAGTVPDHGFKGMSDDTRMDPFPEFKSGRHTPSRGDGNDVRVNVNKGSGLAPEKARPFGGYVRNTKPPKGNISPVRGEHDAT